MTQALQLARRGFATTRPNPQVGCVLVKDGRVVGEGWHVRAGGAHAEIAALAVAGAQAQGSTAYVTLEPCAHHGRTPPCAEALVEAGVSSVVAAMRDPFPEVAGRGVGVLEAAGVAVRIGLMEVEARELNRGYLSRIERGRPLVTLKLAASIDGASAMTSGESQWITGPAARRDVQRWRAGAGAIMTGVATVLADDPSLTVRAGIVDAPRSLRVILDSRLRTPADAKVLSPDADTLVYCAEDSGAAALRKAGAEVVAVALQDDHVSLQHVLSDLAARQVNELLVESGPTLAGRLMASGGWIGL